MVFVIVVIRPIVSDIFLPPPYTYMAFLAAPYIDSHVYHLHLAVGRHATTKPTQENQNTFFYSSPFVLQHFRTTMKHLATTF